jgi:CheY-like chemotaxis protein
MSSILVIDDDEKFLHSCLALLHQAGHQVYGASDGEAALQLARENRIDLVLTDVLMPGVDGLETIVRLGEEYPRLRFIAMSGGGVISQRDCLELTRQLGVVVTLAKPFTPEQLQDAINAVLQRRAAPA